MAWHRGDSGGPDFINGVIAGINQGIGRPGFLPRVNGNLGSFGSLNTFMERLLVCGLGRAPVPFIFPDGAPVAVAAPQPLIFDMNRQAFGYRWACR